ncbi:Ig-like domain-containing protein, partial [Amphritea sp. 1_MG-2023]|uniref:Ig-like domain-containing protein n=1 Tax=Amphritea sp. 1_MG-2023 TaxID=3062670 RepID=UPI0026E142B8
TATLAGTYGTLTLDTASGDYSYSKNAAAIEALGAGDTDSDLFTLTVTDADGALVTQTLTLDITGANDVPVTSVDSYTLYEGTSLIIPANGVLENDADVDGDSLTAVLVSDVSHGTLTLNSDGSFEYHHDGSDTTYDSFSYRASDGVVEGNTVVVNLNITPVNDVIPITDETDEPVDTSPLKYGSDDNGVSYDASVSYIPANSLSFESERGAQFGLDNELLDIANDNVVNWPPQVTLLTREYIGFGLTTVFDPSDYLAIVRESFSYTLPKGIFAHTDSSASVSLEARLSDGSSLPSWLDFDADTGVFSGVPTQEYEDQVLTIVVTAKDSSGATAEAVFNLTVGRNAEESNQAAPEGVDDEAASAAQIQTGKALNREQLSGGKAGLSELIVAAQSNSIIGELVDALEALPVYDENS